MNRLTVGSLFSGYLGLTMAVEAAFDAELRWVSDITAHDKKGTQVGDAPRILEHRAPGVPNLGDITAVDWTAVEPVDIIDGGSPCQDISIAGRRAGMTTGTRSNLWVAMCDAIATIKPAYVVWENVRGSLSARADSDLEPCPGCVGDNDSVPHLRALGRVLGDLADLGFDAEWRGLRAADIGAPHGRYRIFVVAARPDRFARLERRLAAAGETPRWRALGTAPRRDRAPIAALLPTPRSADHYATMGAPAALRHVEAGNGSLPEVLGYHLLPTPTATSYGSNQSESAGSAVRPSLNTLAPLLPTPRTVRGGSGSETVAPHPGRSTSTDNRAGTAADLNRHSPGLRALHLLLPTPTTQPGTGNGHARNLTTELIPTPSVADSMGGHLKRGGARGDELLLKGMAKEGMLDRYDKYGPAITRWETILGRQAPPALIPGTRKLNPAFVEWMMGLPAGWVTDIPGLTHNQQTHALGNGVVPQQAHTAITDCLTALTERPPA